MVFRRTNYSGYLVDNRTELLAHLAGLGIHPRFSRLFGEHVTFRYPDKHTAPKVSTITVVGHAVGDGVEALLVSVDGSTQRPSGGVYHLTLSVDADHKPAESNPLLLDAISEGRVEEIVPFELQVTAF